MIGETSGSKGSCFFGARPKDAVAVALEGGR